MIKFDYITKENIKKYNPNWSYIHDHPYRKLLIGGSSSQKPNPLLKFINHQPNTDEIYLYLRICMREKTNC